MADCAEELEPLFDYSRVQPLNLICLDDDEPPSSPNKRKRKVSDSTVNDKLEVAVIDGEDKKEEEEEDWLPPPPKVSKQLGNDSTLKALRLQKQELAAFAQSAENVTQAVEESVKRELSSSLQSSLDAAAAEPPKPQDGRKKIVICIQDKDGNKQFRVYVDDKFERLFKMYADKAKLDLQSLVFSFDGEKIGAAATPASLDMEDEDIIEVHAVSNTKGVSSTKAT